jgi:hypothetical protein
MNASQKKPLSRRALIMGSFVAAVIITFFIAVPCTLRELGQRAVLGRDVAMWRQVDSAVRIFHLERGHYPASLDEPALQPYLDAHVVAFLREGRLTYHPPAPDSPPTFIIIHMTTPRGDYSSQLDGTPLFPNSK